jgi:hypothetical protein
VNDLLFLMDLSVAAVAMKLGYCKKKARGRRKRPPGRATSVLVTRLREIEPPRQSFEAIFELLGGLVRAWISWFRESLVE